MEAWASQILRNVYFSRGRTRMREQRALERYRYEPRDSGMEPARDDVGTSTLTRSTERALSALPTPYREVLRRVDLDGDSYVEAAEALGIPRGTVMSRLHRGRKILRTALAA